MIIAVSEVKRDGSPVDKIGRLESRLVEGEDCHYELRPSEPLLTRDHVIVRPLSGDRPILASVTFLRGSRIDVRLEEWVDSDDDSLVTSWDGKLRWKRQISRACCDFEVVVFRPL